MKYIDILKKKIIYRSQHRGTKEMDLLLSRFVKKYVNILNLNELSELELLLNIEDDVLHKWYLSKDKTALVPDNNIGPKNLFSSKFLS